MIFILRIESENIDSYVPKSIYWWVYDEANRLTNMSCRAQRVSIDPRTEPESHQNELGSGCDTSRHHKDTHTLVSRALGLQTIADLRSELQIIGLIEFKSRSTSIVYII